MANESLDYLWCLHCERAFKREHSRIILLTAEPFSGHTLELCAYEDCDGDIDLDGRDWESVRGLHPEYPEVPVSGKTYPL